MTSEERQQLKAEFDALQVLYWARIDYRQALEDFKDTPCPGPVVLNMRRRDEARSAMEFAQAVYDRLSLPAEEGRAT